MVVEKPRDAPQALRRLYPYELFSSSRHKLGIYNCVILTARYQGPGPLEDGKAHPVYNALTTLIRRHGMLRAGIVDTDPKGPFFCHIGEVDLRKQVEFKSLSCSSRADYEMQLAELQAWQHNQKWENMSTVPPWKLIIVKGETGTTGGITEEDFMFAFHHALMDGPSARLLHEQLVLALHYPSCALRDKEPEYVIPFLAKADLPPPLEKVIPSNLTKSFIATTIWKEVGPAWLRPSSEPYWAAKAVDFALPRKARLLPIDIAPETLVALLNGCRAHSTTLTGLLHALVLASISRRTDPKEAPSFKSVTPIDYRPILPEGVDPAYKEKLVGCISISNEKHRALEVSAFRSSGSNLNALIWSNAQRIGKALSDRRASLPVDDTMMLLKYIGNMDEYFQKKDGMDRESTWEISNLGIMKGTPPQELEGQGWKITRALFSNSAGVTGPAISLNVMSIPGGSLTASIVWQEGIVSEELASGLASDILASAARFQAQGTFAGNDAVRYG